MDARQTKGRQGWVPLCILLGLAHGESTPAQAQESSSTTVLIVDVQPAVGGGEVMRAGATRWDRAHTNQVLYPGDRVRTRENGRMTLRWFDNSNVRLLPLSDILVEETPTDRKNASFSLLRGLLYFFHRDKPTQARFNTRTASAAVRGTEFLLEFREPEGRTLVTVLDGAVELTNSLGQAELTTGEQGIAEPGSRPSKTAVLEARSPKQIQWFLYYPAVLNAEELELGAAEQQALTDSLAAYRGGDLTGALGSYPAGREPTSAAEKVYFGALLLAVGQVDRAEGLLGALSGNGKASERVLRLARAIETLIAAVTQAKAPAQSFSALNGKTSSEWLAESYWCQSQSDLAGALAAARAAVEIAPQFGPAWARLAELEFSFGRSAEALAALDRALPLAPRNAQALALRGFAHSARNQIKPAVACFDQAIAVDGSLGNAWLGRGLCRIHQGKIAEGLDDLQMAVTVEPQRALLRSYLGKAYSAAKDPRRSQHELELAKQADPKDPTSWLYSALLNQEQNRVNEAVGDLERAQELNDNRSVYRSKMLLDQDRAVRGANLAAIYRDAGMLDTSVREAGRAVNSDYASYSAHLFLANSYNQMLDRRQINLRYETASVDEFLVATLLAPVGAGVLSPTLSQQEYARLFERDGMGLFSSTEYLSRGAWQQYASTYGRLGNTGYALDLYYRNDNGQYANNDLETLSPSLQIKQQITPADSVYLQALYSQSKYGDLAQQYDPYDSATGVNPFARHKETQEPLLLAGYQHEWAPGNHTLVLAGWLQDVLEVDNPLQGTFALPLDAGNQPTQVIPGSVGQDYRSELTVYTFEAQHILQRDPVAFVFGGRYQNGRFDTANGNTVTTNSFVRENGFVLFPSQFSGLSQQVDADMERASFYGYAHWQVVPMLRLIGGVAYDWLEYPENYRFAPVTPGEDTIDQVSPKAGLILTPFNDTVVRAAYSQSLGGVSLDQSFQIEPSQVAGFNQLWRSIIPESVVGASAAAQFQTWDVALEQRLPTRTYLAVTAELLESDLDRDIGIYARPALVPNAPIPLYAPATTRQQLDYEERSLTFTANQLAGREWAFGAAYRISRAELNGLYPEIPASAVPNGGFTRSWEWEAILHRVDLYALYNHRSGFFALADSIWMKQSNEGYSPALAGDDFWQFNIFAGYRFPRRQAEVRIGVLNITDQDYRLNPLNLVNDLPRERTLAASARFSF